MMKTKLIAVLMMVSMASVFAGGSSDNKAAGSGPAPYTIEVGGSTSVTPLMEVLAEEYGKLKPEIKVNISGTGSGDGITNAGITYQIGMSSRDLTPAELGRGLTAELIAVDGIAVIVNKNNAVPGLTVDQVRGIYTGTITNWSQVGGRNSPIAVVSREEGSGTRSAFEEIVDFRGKLLAGANQLTSTGAIIANITQNQDAIGYISLGSLNDSVNALNIGGVTPTAENVAGGVYQIARPFVILTGSNVRPESAAFVKWILSPAGQAIVKSRGYVTVK